MRCLTVAISAILMGSLAIFVRNLGSNPIVVTHLRVSFGFLYLLPFLRFVRLGMFKNGKILSLAFVSLTTIILYIASIQLIEVAIAALLLYMAPLYVVLYTLVVGERISKSGILSLPLAMIGLILLLSPYGKLSLGIMFGFLSGICYAFYFLIAKEVRRFASSIEITFVTLSLSSIVLSPSLIFYDYLIIKNKISWILFLGLIPTALPFVLMNYGIKYCKRESAPIIALLEPVSACIFGSVIFNEILTLKQLIGTSLILLSVSLVARSGVEG